MTDNRLLCLANVLDLFRETELQKPIERRVNNGDVVIRTHRLCENVFDARSLKNRTNAATSDQTGTRARRTEKNFTTVVLTENVVRNRVSLELDVHEVLA